MSNLLSHITASAYGGVAPFMNLASTLCSVNGQEVPCPEFLSFEGLTIGLFWLAFVALYIVALWKVYVKARQPGWAAIVPIYNILIMLRIAGKPWWWIFLMIIPIVNIVIGIMVAYAIAQAFGKGVGFTVGLVLLPIVFYSILAFGGATYKGTGMSGMLGASHMGGAPPPPPVPPTHGSPSGMPPSPPTTGTM